MFFPARVILATLPETPCLVPTNSPFGTGFLPVLCAQSLADERIEWHQTAIERYKKVGECLEK